MDLNAAYRASARVTRREARNFYYAFLSLPGKQRRSIYALYAFCREADDIVDDASDSGPGADDVRDALNHLQQRLLAAAAGSPIEPQDAALADTIERFGVNPNDLADVLAGMEMDLTLRRVETVEDLDQYCYLAASAVGLSTVPILNDGIPPTDAMREAAINLGLGMQYVNILRDVSEDLDRDRIYLPQDVLRKFDVDPQTLRSRTMTDELRRALALHADRARTLLDRGRQLLPMLPPHSRSCPWLLAEIYGRLLERIVAANYEVLHTRFSLPKT